MTALHNVSEPIGAQKSVVAEWEAVQKRIDKFNATWQQILADENRIRNATDADFDPDEAAKHNKREWATMREGLEILEAVKIHATSEDRKTWEQDRFQSALDQAIALDKEICDEISVRRGQVVEGTPEFYQLKAFVRSYPEVRDAYGFAEECREAANHFEVLHQQNRDSAEYLQRRIKQFRTRVMNAI